ncbi:MAG: zf-HC2 domain-containing protein [Pyrinomonadaceae bacterium]
MELEFDKEIDALLRDADLKTVPPDGRTMIGEHLGPDELVSFAENALPEKTRARYTQHFASCENCRRILSRLIVLNSEAAPDVVLSSAAPARAVANDSWYSRLFRLPQLAAAMGAVVLAFTGFLGFLAYQSFTGSQSEQLSKVTVSEPSRDADTSNASNAAASANTYSANIPSKAAAAANAAESNPVIPPDPTLEQNKPKESRPAEIDSVIAKGVTAPPPPPAAAEESRSDEAASRPTISAESEMRIDPATAAAPPTATPAPYAAKRDSVQSLKKSQRARTDDSALKTTAPVRTVAGRKFDRRDGVWYDEGYRGQTTINVRRGTEEFWKLDDGLRAIADGIGGTVVVLWKDRAYRIQ